MNLWSLFSSSPNVILLHSHLLTTDLLSCFNCSVNVERMFKGILNLLVFVLINQFLTIYDFSFIFCLSFMSAFLFSYLDWASIASRIHHSKLNLTDYSAKWDDNFYLDINRSVAEREENITPCSYHNAVISQNCVRMMKCTYLCCKI